MVWGVPLAKRVYRCWLMLAYPRKQPIAASSGARARWRCDAEADPRALNMSLAFDITTFSRGITFCTVVRRLLDHDSTTSKNFTANRDVYSTIGAVSPGIQRLVGAAANTTVLCLSCASVSSTC